MFKIVEQMPIIQYNRQPTVAIITAEYCEKVAVDILIDNKETFVRYTTVGKNAKHQIFCFKYFIYYQGTIEITEPRLTKV